MYSKCIYVVITHIIIIRTVRKKILSYYKIMIIVKRLTAYKKKMIYIYKLYVLYKFKAKF